MKIQRVVFFLFLLSTFTTAFWGQETDKRKKRKGKKYGARKEASEKSESDMFAGTEGPSAGGVDREALKNERLEKARRYRQKGGGPKEGELLSDSDVKSVLDDASIPDTEYKSDAERMNTSNEDILNDWEKHMHDFVPEDMSTLVVPAHTIVTVYEDIEHTKPTVIKGAFYSQGYASKQRVSVIIEDPEGNVVYKRRADIQGIILFDFTVSGEYSFTFANMVNTEDVSVTLALHTFEEEEEEPISWDFDEEGNRYEKGGEDDPDQTNKKVKEEDLAADEMDLGNFRTTLRHLQTKTKQIQSECKLSLLRQTQHNEDLLTGATWNMVGMLIEVSAFIGILVFQLHHMKQSLDNKLVL